MNIKNLKTLIDQLKRLPDQNFYMSVYIAHPEDYDYQDSGRDKSCGTIGCIAGWASLLNGGPQKEDGPISPAEWAADWLGLDYSEEKYLFMGKWRSGPFCNVTRAQAIAQLESMLPNE